MEVECFGPNGEKFAFSFEVLETAASGTYDVGYVRAAEINDLNRKAMQLALETWCVAFKPNHC